MWHRVTKDWRSEADIQARRHAHEIKYYASNCTLRELTPAEVAQEECGNPQVFDDPEEGQLTFIKDIPLYDDGHIYLVDLEAEVIDVGEVEYGTEPRLSITIKDEYGDIADVTLFSQWAVRGVELNSWYQPFVYEYIRIALNNCITSVSRQNCQNRATYENV